MTPTESAHVNHGHSLSGNPGHITPLYHYLEAALLRVPDVIHLHWDFTVWLMRLLSILLVAPLPILAWATTRELLAGAAALVGESIDRLRVDC